jgi:hypothetical protein
MRTHTHTLNSSPLGSPQKLALRKYHQYRTSCNDSKLALSGLITVRLWAQKHSLAPSVLTAACVLPNRKKQNAI